VTSALAPAKINLALVVGPRRGDGKHEVATVLQRVDLADSLVLEPADNLRVSGFAEDTIVTAALLRLAHSAKVAPAWHVAIDKRIPVAAGLAGGSSDAATALRLANDTLAEPLPPRRLAELAAAVGADVPFFLAPGPQLGTGDGAQLRPLALPDAYHVVLFLPDGAGKESTAAVYDAFDRRDGEADYEVRRRTLFAAIEGVGEPRDLAKLPRNDLASSAHASELERLGAFRADVSGAGPVVYGLFDDKELARGAATALGHLGTTWSCSPTWYG
jgi:4-diphosphocytidyl-2-C-methyl-D-erythritol kinase